MNCITSIVPSGDSLAARRAADEADWRLARRVAPYGDDARVGAATEEAIARGVTVLQVHRLAAADRDHMAELAAMFAPPPRARVLDVGCGIGAPAAHLKALRPDLDITLLNVSPAQLALCPDGFAKVAADAHALPFAAASFDAVMVLYTLGHLLPAAAIPEFARVLRPGGVLFIWDLAGAEPRRLAQVLGYRPHPPRRIAEEAALAGLVFARIAFPPDTDATRFAGILGGDLYRQLFRDVIAVAYRLRAPRET